MEKDEKNEAKFKFLGRTLEFTKNIENLAEDLLQLLKSKDSSVLDPIRPIIHPKRKASAVLEFYNSYLQAAQTFKEVESKIKESGIATKPNLKIEDLETGSTLDLLGLLIREIDELEKHSEIKIANKLAADQKKSLNKYLEIIKNTVLSALERLPKVVDKLDVYSRFILKYYDTDQYLKEYIGVCQARLSFFEIENREAAILQQTKNLTEHFNMIKELNTRILGRRFSRTINDGLIQLLVLDLKTILGSYLLKIEKSQSPFHIPFLIQLYSRLRHSGGNMVEEIEQLFELKPEVMKLIFNCFIQFFGQLDLLESPNGELVSEDITVLLAEILEQFALNKDAKREWVSSFGSSFGIFSVDELGFNLCEKCLLKITSLSEQLDVRERSIYTINNIHTLREYFLKFSGLDIKQLIYKNCETVIGVLKIGLESKPPADAYKFLFGELLAAQKYYLPEEERTYIAQKLKQIVEDGTSKKTIQGNPHTLLRMISEAYAGNKAR